MNNLTVEQIESLSKNSDGEIHERLKEIIDWHINRKFLLIKGLSGLAVSAIIALGFGLLKDEITLTNIEFVISLSSIIGLMIYIVIEYSRIGKVDEQYVDLIELSKKLENV